MDRKEGNVDRKDYDRLEDIHLSKLRQFDDAGRDLYDLKNENKRIWDEGQMMIQDIQLQSPEVNLNNFMIDLEGRFDDFNRQVLRKEDDLEKLRWEEKRNFVEKTGGYR
nr:hypothetical protein [Streptococcus mutans]